MRVGFACRMTVVGAMTAAGLTLPVLVGSPAAATTTEPLEQPDVAAAAALARQVRQPVQVSGLTTEDSDTAANPDGSLTARFSSSPVRVRQGERWTAVDTTLRRDTDGSVAAAATVSQLRFSGGGTGPAVQLTKAGKTLQLWWPTALPAPTLSADTATYPQVWPGMDLVLTARADGFSEVLVLHNRPAATNPALRTLRLRLSVLGLRLRSQGGGFVAEDSSTGAVVFTSGAPLMWDSAGGPARQPQWPVHGDRVTAMGASLAGSDLTVLPDVTVLDDPATTYPVYVDPAVSGSRNEWAMISSGFPAQPYHNFGGNEGLGLCDVQDDGACVRDQVKRIGWEFGISSAVHGTRVLKATFAAYETHAYNCTPREVQLWRVGALSSSTTWNNHAGTWGRLLSTVNVARDPNCGNKPAMVEFDATIGAQEFADNRWPGLTVGLRATNEATMSLGWKRFQGNNATLSVTYNSRPNPPASPATAGKGCAGAPFVGDDTPSLTARVSDPDGDVDLTAEWAWDRWNTSINGWERVAHVQKTNLASGTTAVLTLGVDAGTGGPLEHGRRYRWTLLVIDPVPGFTPDVSGWMDPWCEFEVDTQRPNVVSGVSSTVYPEYISGVDEAYHGGVGLTGGFTFTANGVTDVAGYLWGWSDPPVTSVAAPTLGGPATVDLTPPPPFPNSPTLRGTLTLRVRSVDRAGLLGDVRVYPMRVGRAADPAGIWLLADAAGSTSLADSSAGNHPAATTSVTAGVAGRLLSGPGQTAPTAGWFNGSTSYATTGTPIVDTSKSFTVSVWVRPDANTNGWRAILSATGGQNSSFFLRRDPDNKFHFTLVSTTTWTQAVSTTTSRVGKWTHLVGVYDAGSHQAHLYVNGVRESTTAVPDVYAATGAFEIGRSWWANSWGYHPNWHGAVAEVKVWSRVVSDFEAPALAGTQAGAWSLDGHGGDDTAWGRELTPSNVTWVGDRAGNPALAARFNGTSSQAVTAGPAVRTDQSFTITGWVRLDNKSASMAMIGQDGVRASGFAVGYEPAFDGLTFVMYSADVDNPGFTFVWTAAPPVGVWRHVVAVYDATAGHMRLYLNTTLVGTVAYTSGWHATGPTVLGRFRWNGTASAHFAGSLDDVRVLAGALPQSEINKLFQP